MRLFTETQSLRARLWAGLVALVLWGCGGDDAGLGTEKPVASITVTPPTSTIAPGTTAQLQATAKDPDGATLTDRSFTWSSSDNAIATVSATGLATGLAIGTATVTAASEGKSGTAEVTVQAEPSPSVASVSVEPNTVALAPAETVQLTVTIRDAAGNVLTDRTVAWSSSNTAVASVTAAGLVTGMAAGTATVTATSEQQSGSAAVTVATAALDFTTVSAGFDHTCVVTATGDAFCWGGNEHGQLGVGTATGPELCAHGNGESGPCSKVPVLVPGGLSFATVSTGLHYTCGITGSGAAYCWGRNGIGQLGDGTTAERLSPVPVVGGLSFTAISAGTAHTCGLTTAGAVYCWGTNSFGGLGDGTTTPRLAPVPVAGGVSFASVAVGMGHTCGVMAAGAAYCWGLNEEGQLGDGTTAFQRLTPTLVTGGLTFASLTASFIHTCAVTVAGAAYCWGWNREGELGSGTAIGPETCNLDLGGTTDCSTVPVPVVGDLSFAQLSPGVHNLQSCGVTTEGAAYCWGHNANGELGVGTTTGPQRCVQVNSPTVACSPVPVPVSGGIGFTAVAAGQGYTCGMTAEGAAYCWGANGLGQLGDGTTTNRLTPARVALE